MNTLTLDGLWSLHDASKPEQTFSAPVPGSVHDALLAKGAIADAHHGYGERDQMWVGLRTWVYTRTFEVSATLFAHDHIDLVADGLDTFCQIRINGHLVATTDNMFRSWRFDAKPFLKIGSNSIEAIFSPAEEVMQAGHKQRHLPAWNELLNNGKWGPTGRGYARKQACQFGWDWGPQCPSAGIWLPIRLEAWSTARIEDWRLDQKHEADGSVTLSLYTKPNTGADLEIEASFSLAGAVLASVKKNFWGGHEWVFTIRNPALWWPNGMGEQTLHILEILLRSPSGELLDSRRARIGLRHLELVQEPDAFGRSFYFRVNGRRFFAKGSNWIPLDAHPSAQNLEPRYRRDLLSARSANMNMLRVWGGGYFSHDCFYDICDELGILIWQDLMFGCGVYPIWDERFLESVRMETLQQAKRLRHHACLACWCGNNELEMGFTAQDWQADSNDHKQTGKLAWASYLELFERVLPSALMIADPTTPYLRGSPHCSKEDGRDGNSQTSGDFHLWEVWFSSAPFEKYRNYPHRFLSEFGFQSMPDAALLRAYAPDGETVNLQSEWLAFRQRSQPGNFRVAEITTEWFGQQAVNGDFTRFCTLSQLTHGLGLKIGIEHWRRLFPRTGGATYWQLNDRWAAPTWATLDYHGNWKASHHLARGFFAPLLVMGIEDRERLTVAAYIVNDHAAPISGAFKLTVTDCSGNLLGTLEKAVTASPNCDPTDLGEFSLKELTGKDLSADNCLVWLEYSPDGKTFSPSHNLVLFARPCALKLQKSALSVRWEPTANPDESLLIVQTGQVPALWVHLAREELLSNDARQVTLEEEFFCLPPHSVRTVKVLHKGQSSAACSKLNLLSIADYLLS